MEEFFSSGNAAIKDADKCAREMRVAGLLLERLEKNTYFSDLEKARKRQLLAEGFSMEEIERAESKIFGGDPLPEGNKTKEKRERLARLDRVLGEIWEQGAEYERIRKREDAEYLGKYLSRKIFGWWVRKLSVPHTPPLSFAVCETSDSCGTTARVRTPPAPPRSIRH